MIILKKDIQLDRQKHKILSLDLKKKPNNPSHEERRHISVQSLSRIFYFSRVFYRRQISTSFPFLVCVCVGVRVGNIKRKAENLTEFYFNQDKSYALVWFQSSWKIDPLLSLKSFKNVVLRWRKPTGGPGTQSRRLDIFVVCPSVTAAPGLRSSSTGSRVFQEPSVPWCVDSASGMLTAALSLRTLALGPPDLPSEDPSWALVTDEPWNRPLRQTSFSLIGSLGAVCSHINLDSNNIHFQKYV